MPDEPPAAWPHAATPRQLLRGHAHVYRIDLDRTQAEVQTLAAVLAPDERARAARQRRPRDGARWAVARAALRHVLAAHAGCGPADVRLVVDELGKPHVAPAERSPTSADRAAGIPADLSFNLSHSDGLALVAVARGCRVGVDIEAAGGRNDLAAIAARYFSPAEQAYLAGLPAEARPEAFFVLWTAKEAYTKAIGAGLSAGFTRFDVVVTGDGGLTLAGAAGAAWTLRRLAPAPGYHAAIALDAPDPMIARWLWTPPTDRP